MVMVFLQMMEIVMIQMKIQPRHLQMLTVMVLLLQKTVMIHDAAVGATLNGQSMKSYYTDSDSDGFGDSAASAEMTCVPPTGKVTNNSDCNDGDANTYPGAGYSESGSLASACVTDVDEDGYGDQNPVTGALLEPTVMTYILEHIQELSH